MEILSLSADVVPNAQQPPQSDKQKKKKTETLKNTSTVVLNGLVICFISSTYSVYPIKHHGVY